MATLSSQSIASSYEQLLHVDRDGGGNGTTLVSVKDGDNGTTFDIQLSSNSTNFQTDFQIGGTAVSSTAAELNLLDGSSDANSTVSKAVILDGSGNIALPDGKGIDFAATADSSGTMSSEVLDDYEEGTWTPVVAGGSTAGTYTATAHGAKYTKIGDLVTVTCTLGGVNESSAGSGDLQISGIPFAGVSEQLYRIGSVMIDRFNYRSNAHLSSVIYSNQSYISIFETTSSANDATYVSVADWANNGADIHISITYKTN